MHHTMPRRSIQHCSIPYQTIRNTKCAVSYRTIWYRPTPYRTIPYRAVPHNNIYRTAPSDIHAIPHNTVLQCAPPYGPVNVLHRTIRYNTAPYHTALVRVTQYRTKPYRTTTHHTNHRCYASCRGEGGVHFALFRALVSVAALGYNQSATSHPAPQGKELADRRRLSRTMRRGSYLPPTSPSNTACRAV